LVSKFSAVTEIELSENIEIPVKVGDTILTGKFKNKKTVVKDIGKDEHGMPTINGKKVVTFRIVKNANIFENHVELHEDEKPKDFKTSQQEKEDEKYTHIGYGKFKQKGKEDSDTASIFVKQDNGKYTELPSDVAAGGVKTDDNGKKVATSQSDSEKGTQVSPDAKQSTGDAPMPPGHQISGPADFSHAPDIQKLMKKTFFSNTQNIRDYTDKEYQDETGEYFENDVTREVAPNAFKDESDMIQKMKNAKPTYLSSKELQQMNNTDVGDILSAFDSGGPDAMKRKGKELADEYGKNWEKKVQAVKSGKSVPAPIALKDKNGNLHLVAGNTRLMAFTAHGKNLPVKIIPYNGVFNTEGGSQQSASNQNTVKTSKVSKIGDKIKNWSREEKQFFRDEMHKPGSEMRRDFATMIKSKSKGAYKAIKQGFRHEVAEFKEAGSAAKKIAQRKPLNNHEKKALKSVAMKVVTTAIFGAATGGVAHGVAAFGKHVAMELIPHIVGETILKGIGRAALFANVEDDEQYLDKFINAVAYNMENMKITPEMMNQMIDSYNEKKLKSQSPITELSKQGKHFKNLGVPRKDMPQINSKDTGDFIKWFNMQGVSSKSMLMPLSKLELTQHDIDYNKVDSLSSAPRTILSKPIIVSNDNYILDGHHRVLALYNLDNDAKIPAVRINLPMKHLLDKSHDYPKVSYKQIDESFVLNEAKSTLKLSIPKNIRDLHKVFKKNGKKLYVVGGAVRDAILGQTPKDFDLATDATPDEVLAIAKKEKLQSTEVGKSFGVVIINGDEKISVKDVDQMQ